ncbi:restriction endonuclease subunit S [Plantactinospora siamensis]|uniref:Restriction endonuclease subunit S n=1 Tax=Plantactinospora siamensis TaxID=555372 RepID=A0ABV6NVL5_9ACTN
MSRYPNDWQHVRLADSGHWLSGGTPNTAFPPYWNGSIPWISAASLKSFHITDSDRRITPLGARSGSRMVPPNTVLFVVRGMSLKSEFRVGVTEREVAFGQDCKAIIPRPDIDSKFLAYSLRANASRVLSMVDEAGHGTGRLPTDQLGALTIGAPKRSEQRQIVKVLESLDDSIESTARLINKKEKLRDGTLLQFFQSIESASDSIVLANLRRGDSPILKIGPFGSSLKGRDWVQSGVPVITIGSLGVGRFHVDELLHITPSKANLLSAYRVRVGDVVFSRVADVGRSVVIGRDQEGWIMSSNLLRISADPDIVRPTFLQLSLAHSPRVRGQLRATTNSSGRDVTSARIIAALSIDVPPRPQQDLICSAWQAATAAIAAERAQLAKLRSLKEGLVEDLTTGRVRL